MVELDLLSINKLALNQENKRINNHLFLGLFIWNWLITLEIFFGGHDKVDLSIDAANEVLLCEENISFLKGLSNGCGEKGLVRLLSSAWKADLT